MTPVDGSLVGWREELRSASLVGTARREAPEPPPALGLPGAAPGNREQALLASAAVADVLARAGVRASRPQHDLTPAPSDDVPVVGPRAEQLLTLLLGQSPFPPAQTRTMLAAWLAAATEAGQRVPPRLLPQLFARISSVQAASRGDLAAAIGGRGRWLAALHPDVSLELKDRDLKDVTDAPAEADGTPWMELPTTLAVDVLAAARRRDPVGTREELVQHWASFPAKQRSELVVALTAGLGPDDEPFLEQVLDDKALSVRKRAAALLAALPDSDWRRRTGARLAALLRVEGTLRRRLEIAVPEAPDAAGVRDGLAPAKGTPSVQQRAEWLRQLVDGAPLSTWTDVTGKDPGTTVAMLRGDQTVLALLRDPVLRSGDPAWALALFEAGVRAPDLLALLPPERRRAHVLAGLTKRPAPGDVLDFLRAGPHPWEPEVARAVLGLMLDPHLRPDLDRLTPVMTSAVPATLQGEVRALVDRVHGPQRRKLFADIVQFHEFHLSLTEAFR